MQGKAQPTGSFGNHSCTSNYSCAATGGVDTIRLCWCPHRCDRDAPWLLFASAMQCANVVYMWCDVLVGVLKCTCLLLARTGIKRCGAVKLYLIDITSRFALEFCYCSRCFDKHGGQHVCHVHAVSSNDLIDALLFLHPQSKTGNLVHGPSGHRGPSCHVMEAPVASLLQA